MSLDPSKIKIITRVKKIVLGLSSGSSYTWLGIKDVKITDVNPWEHIEIPAGSMIHQHLHSPHVHLEVMCYDLYSMEKALFDTVIDTSGATSFYAIVQSTLKKHKIDYFVIHFVSQDNKIITATLTDARVETMALGETILGKDAVFMIKFTADGVVYGESFPDQEEGYD